jgi:hypothetical protein
MIIWSREIERKAKGGKECGMQKQRKTRKGKLFLASGERKYI